MNARGPDFQKQYGPIALTSDLYITFAVSVLSIRGFKQEQPFVDEDGNILIYNGEIYEAPFQVSYYEILSFRRKHSILID